MAKKRSKHMSGEAFSANVCDAIRHHIGERKVLESKRTIAFEDRDAASEEKHDIEDHDSEEYSEACKRHSDAIDAVDSLSAQIKWHRNQVDDLVEKADEPNLDFMYDMPPPDPKPWRKDKGEDDRPVGVPNGQDSFKFNPKKMQLEPAKVEGVDQHLAAAVVELGLADKDTDKLVAAGMTTIGHLVEFVDRDGNLMDVLNVGQEIKARILKALKSYRAKHRQAMKEAEHEE